MQPCAQRAVVGKLGPIESYRPYGTDPFLYTIQAINCLATFILSLRDKGLLRPKASPTPRTRGAIQSQRSARYLQHSIAPSLHRPNTPTLQHSNTPTLQHSNTPTLQHSITPSLQHSNTPTLHHSNTPTLHHSITPSLRVPGFEDTLSADPPLLFFLRFSVPPTCLFQNPLP